MLASRVYLLPPRLHQTVNMNRPVYCNIELKFIKEAVQIPSFGAHFELNGYLLVMVLHAQY